MLRHKLWQPLLCLLLTLTAGCERSQVRAAAAARPNEATTRASTEAKAPATTLPGGIGSRVLVVERSSETLAVYDLSTRALLPKRITGLGNLTHATMVFSPDLESAYLATRNGKLSRIALATLEVTGDVFTSKNSIDIAVSQDGRYVATAEYVPGGITILDAKTLLVVKRLDAGASRVTGIVDAPGNRFVCVLMEGEEVWIVDASGGAEQIRIEHRIKTSAGEPYDAMITPDGRYYLVGHLNSDRISVVDVQHPEQGARQISLRDPSVDYDKAPPVKIPHMASWAVAGDRVFVPLVGEKRLAVLERGSFRFLSSVPVKGHPVYAVRAPSEREIWVSFSGVEDDAYVQVVDVETLSVKHTLSIGKRIYHMDFTPRGSHVLITANQDDLLALVDATSYTIVDRENVRSPSGVFGAWRAFRMGL